MLRRCVWSRNIKNRRSIYIYDISRLRVKVLRYRTVGRVAALQFQLIQDTSRQLLGWILPDTVNTVKCSWWWAKTSPETCRAEYIYIGFHAKYPSVFVRFEWTLNFSQYIFKKYLNIKFYENPSNGSWVFFIRTNGRTDGKTDMTNLIVTFCNIANAPKNMWQQKSTNSTVELLLISGKRALIIFHFLIVKLHQTAKIFANSDINKTAGMSKPCSVWCRDTAFYHLPSTT